MEAAVAILKRLIAEGNSEMLTPAGTNGGLVSYANGNRAGGIGGSSGGWGWPEIGRGIGREGSELSRGRGSPPTAPCRFVPSRPMYSMIDSLLRGGTSCASEIVQILLNSPLTIYILYGYLLVEYLECS